MQKSELKKSDPAISQFTVWTVNASGQGSSKEDHVAVEEPLEIRVKGRAVAVTMRTPGYDGELAAGFLLTEGLIPGREVISSMSHCQDAGVLHRENILNVFLTESGAEEFQFPSERGPVNVSCGLCGKTSIEAVHQQFPPLEQVIGVDSRILATLPEKLSGSQAVFSKTGGLHAAALFDFNGELIVLREDIGRHNAVDKVIGHQLLAGALPLKERILVVSGRASFEILQKALAARIPVIAAVSAPSSLAVEFARENRQTLVGFLRGESMNFYTEPYSG